MERKLIAAAVSGALALPMAAQAVEFAASGHVNRAIMSVDGTGAPNEGDLQHVDANVSETRVRFLGSEELENGNTVGVNLEYASGSTSGSYGAGADSGLRVRHQNVYVSGEWGQLTIGQTQATSDQAPFANLGGLSGLGGVTAWCAHASNGSVACGTFSEGRKELLRYDSPAIGPVSIAVTTGNDDYWDAMLKIAGSFGEAGYDLRVGHVAEYDAPVDATDATVGVDDNNTIVVIPASAATTEDAGDTMIASASVAFGQGTAATVAWGDKDSTKQNYQHVALDHSYGGGSVGVYYKRGEDETSDVDSSNWGIGVGHDIGGGAEVYAGYRNMEEDGKDDVELIVAGMRVTFN